MPGYTKQRSNWQDFPVTSTPILASNLNGWETTLNDIRTGAVRYAFDYGAAPAASAATNTTAINSALSDMSAAGGGTVLTAPGTHSFNTLSFAGLSNVHLIGAGGIGTSFSTATTTGNIFDFTNASFCSVESMQIISSAARSAGAIFYLDVGAGACQRNEFRRLRIAGGWRGFQLNNCTTTTIDEIQFTDFNAAHGWHSLINLSGTATSTMISNLRGGTAAAVTNAALFVDGAGVDTLQVHNTDMLNLGASTGMTGVILAGGEWMRFTDCSFEAGTTGYGMIVNAGKGIDLIGCHFIGVNGLSINAGTAVRMIGGEILVTQQHGVNLNGGSHHEFIGVTLSDLSQQTNNAYNGFNIAAGVSDFTIENCMFGNMYASGNGNGMATAITVNVGASDRYVIRGNRAASTGVVTPWADSGTGTDKIVKDNVSVGSGFPSVASAATVTLPANAEFINVTGTTTITSVTTSYKGRRVMLNFAGILTFTDGLNLKLAGNFVTTADDTITLVCDGTNWIEISRSVN